ncbi:MAG: oligosaccharide flippase family protein [Defluviimonas sp.]|uniref:oligosaccharide flippase family protein n=1 Tax=Albidovulum sp. TaxID=1872424 RepID=UPI002A33BC20|nr:oligosaccharide flippase family protein [Defluviimonas sp.]
MLKKATMLLSGSALGSLLLLARNLIVARMVSPEDYGIATTLAAAMSVVEMLSYIGLNQLIVIDKDGDTPEMQRGLQGFQVLRGCLSALVLFLAARPYARFVGAEEITWAYQMMAVVPLVSGFQHFDIHRLKRHMRFRPWTLVQSIPPILAVTAVLLTYLFVDDYRIMLVSLLVQALTFTAVSHLSAERRYELGFDFPLMRRAAYFGWPLLLDGTLLFFVFYGERLVVTNRLGLVDAATFSWAITLTLTPTLIMENVVQTMFLPKLSAARNRPEDFRRLAVAAVEAGMATGALLILGTQLIGGAAVSLLLGAKYAAVLPILVPGAVLQAIRVCKTGLSVVSLSRERSGNSMASNAFRVASLPISWMLVSHGGGLMTVIWVAIAAEVLGFLLMLQLTVRRASFSHRWILPQGAAIAVLAALALGIHALHPTATTFDVFRYPGHWLLIVATLAALSLMRSLGGYIFGRRIRIRPSDA